MLQPSNMSIYWIYQYVSSFHCLYFLPGVPTLLCHFRSVERNSATYYLRIGLLVTDHMKEVFTCYWIELTVLFLQHLKNMPLPYGLYGHWWKIHLSNCFSTNGKVTFLSHCFFVFSSQKFWLRCVLAWISLSLSCLGFIKLLDSVGLWLARFRKYSASISPNTLSAPPSFSSFWDCNKNDRSFVKVPQVPDTTFSFFQASFSLLFKVGNFYSVFPLPSPFCWSAIHWVFHFNYTFQF